MVRGSHMTPRLSFCAGTQVQQGTDSSSSHGQRRFCEARAFKHSADQPTLSIVPQHSHLHHHRLRPPLSQQRHHLQSSSTSLPTNGTPILVEAVRTITPDMCLMSDLRIRVNNNSTTRPGLRMSASPVGSEPCSRRNTAMRFGMRCMVRMAR